MDELLISADHCDFEMLTRRLLRLPGTAAEEQVHSNAEFHLNA